jgi:hypothetical protein
MQNRISLVVPPILSTFPYASYVGQQDKLEDKKGEYFEEGHSPGESLK